MANDELKQNIVNTKERSKYANILNLKKINIEQIDRLDDIEDMEKTMHYKNILGRLNQEAIQNQAEQIINYSDNYVQSGKTPVVSLFENCVISMKKIISTEYIDKKEYKEFINSLMVSQQCIENSDKYAKEFESLKNKNQNGKRFIIAPISAREHVFNSVIYWNGENYEIIVINKGGRFDSTSNKEYHSFEKYVISEKKINDVLPILGVLDKPMKMRSVSEIYKFLDSISKPEQNEKLLMIDARNQRVGNCYFKEIEEGFKFAYSLFFNKFRQNKDLNTLTPKLPCDTQKFHIELLNNLKKNCGDDDTVAYINNLVDEYEKNKQFRIRANIKNDSEKEEIFFDIFLGKKKEQSNKELKKSLEKIDERTLKENLGFFINLLKSRSIRVPSFMYDNLNNALDVDFLRSFEKNIVNNNITKREDINFLKEYFPAIGQKVERRVNNREIGEIIKLISKKMENGDFELAELLVNRCLELNGDRGNRILLYEQLAEIKDGQGYTSEAIGWLKKAYNESIGIDFNIAKRVAQEYNRKFTRLEDEISNLEEVNENIREDETMANDIYMQTFKLEKLKVFGDTEEIIKSCDIIERILAEPYKDNKDEVYKENYNEVIPVKMEKAYLLRKMGKTEDAIKIYEDVISLIDKYGKKEEKLFYIKADALIYSGKNNKALEMCDNKIKEIIKKHEEDTMNIEDDQYKKEIDLKFKKDIEQIRDKKYDIEIRKNEWKGNINIPRKYEIDNELDSDIYNSKKKADNYLELRKEDKALECYVNVLNKTYDRECFENATKILRKNNRTKDALKLANDIIEKYKNKGFQLKGKEYIRVRQEKMNCLTELGQIKLASSVAESLGKYILNHKEVYEEDKELGKNILMTYGKYKEMNGEKRKAQNVYKKLLNMHKKEKKIFPRNLVRSIKNVKNKITPLQSVEHTMAQTNRISKKLNIAGKKQQKDLQKNTPKKNNLKAHL